LAKPRVKESRMRVKKRVKRRVKKGVKRVKSAPPEAYLAGAGVLVGGAAMVLLATTKSGRELLIRTVQLTLLPQAEEPESQEPDVPDADKQESQEPDVPDADKQESQEPDVPDADKQESQEPDVPDADKQESQESDAREDVDNEPAEDAEAEGEPEEDSNGDDESRVTDLKPRDQRPRSAAPGRHPRSPRKAPAPAKG
jgi:cytoskeletal protein RodZ